MKLLRNPIVVAILAVVAVVMVIYQVVGPRAIGALFGPQPGAAPPTVEMKAPAAASKPGPAAVAAAAKPTPKAPPVRAVTYTNLDAALLPDRNVDRAGVEASFKTWVSAPLRDPFLLLAPVAWEAGLLDKQTNSPVASWTLKAIWNQTDSRLAVINDRVCRVGDIIIDGYRLVRIEKDEVWFQGPYRNERLGFPPPRQGASPSRK